MKACKYGPLKHPRGRQRCKKRPSGRRGPVQQFAGARRRRRRR